MTTDPTPHHTTYIDVPEAVGVFDSFETLQAAIYDLRVSGSGSQIEMKAATGGIGALTIDTQDGDLIALAQDDIDLAEVSGDLALRSVESQLGSVALTVV